MVYNIVVVSGVQRSEPALQIHTTILFQILSPHGSLQNIEQSSLCSTVGPCWLSILYTVVCVCKSCRGFCR